MVLRSLEPTRGQLRKARNLVQADAPGDGSVGKITGNTLKAIRRAQCSHASEGKEFVGNAMSGWLRILFSGFTVVELVPGRGEKPEEGSGRESGLTA
jgi:hypothetical protein